MMFPACRVIPFNVACNACDEQIRPVAEQILRDSSSWSDRRPGSARRVCRSNARNPFKADGGASTSVSVFHHYLIVLA
jgi:hypothetical protein